MGLGLSFKGCTAFRSQGLTASSRSPETGFEGPIPLSSSSGVSASWFVTTATGSVITPCCYAFFSTMDQVLSEAVSLKHFSHKLCLNTKGVQYFGHLRRCRWCLQASPKCVIDASGLLVLKEMGVRGGSPKSQALIHPLSVPTSMPRDVTRKKNGTEPMKRRELSSQKRKDFLRSPVPPSCFYVLEGLPHQSNFTPEGEPGSELSHRLTGRSCRAQDSPVFI